MFKLYDGRENFFQWDLDRKLIVEDATIKQVHFCNKSGGCSLVCETYKEDGLNVVNVPNILLQENWRINVYAYDVNYTKYSQCFKVEARTKPESYVYTETEILTYETILEEIDKKGYATKEFVENKISEIDVTVDLTDYATKIYVDNAITSAITTTLGGSY